MLKVYLTLLILPQHPLPSLTLRELSNSSFIGWVYMTIRMKQAIQVTKQLQYVLDPTFIPFELGISS